MANPVNLTNAHFKSLEITENLNINYINGRSINEFLNKRFLVHTDYPQYITTPITFDNLHIIGEYTIKTDQNIYNIIPIIIITRIVTLFENSLKDYIMIINTTHYIQINMCK